MCPPWGPMDEASEDPRGHLTFCPERSDNPTESGTCLESLNSKGGTWHEECLSQAYLSFVRAEDIEVPSQFQPPTA